MGDNDPDMFQDLEVIDFHAHFPVPEPAWEIHRKAKEAELGERRTKIAREYATALQHRLAAGLGLSRAGARTANRRAARQALGR